MNLVSHFFFQQCYASKTKLEWLFHCNCTSFIYIEDILTAVIQLMLVIQKKKIAIFPHRVVNPFFPWNTRGRAGHIVDASRQI